MLISSFYHGNYEISVHDSIQSIDIEKWDGINAAHLHSTYLDLIEFSKPLDLNFRYIFIQEDNKICAIIYFQLLKFRKRNIRFGNSYGLNLLASVILKLRPFHILICGNLFAVNYPGIQCNQNCISRKDLFEIVHRISNEIKNDVFIIKDLDEELTKIAKHNEGWKEYPEDLTMALNIDLAWRNFNDYILSLNKKYRSRAKKITDSGKKLSRREMTEDEIKMNLGTLEFLFNQVVNRQTIRMGLIGSDYFYEFKKKFPEKFSIIGYYFEGKLVSFASYIEHEQTLELHYIGIDYSMNDELKIYFNILFDGVGRAIQKKKHILELGRTAREAKANLGAKAVYFNDFVFIKNRLAKFLADLFGNYFQREMGEKWMNKHPFK